MCIVALSICQGETYTPFPTSKLERIQLGQQLLNKRRFSDKVNNLFKEAIAAETDLGFVLTSGTNVCSYLSCGFVLVFGCIASVFELR